MNLNIEAIQQTRDYLALIGSKRTQGKYYEGCTNLEAINSIKRNAPVKVCLGAVYGVKSGMVGDFISFIGSDVQYTDHGQAFARALGYESLCDANNNLSDDELLAKIDEVLASAN